MARRKSATIYAGPRFNSKGSRTGYEIRSGYEAQICKSQKSCQRELTKSIKLFLAENYIVTAVIKDAKGNVVSKTKYTPVKGCAPTTEALSIPKSKRKSSKRKSSKRKSKKKTSGSGRKMSWPKFWSMAAKRGYTQKQAGKKYAKYKSGKGAASSLLPKKKTSKRKSSSKKKTSKRKSSSKRSGRSAGQKRYAAFSKAAYAKGATRKQVSATWKRAKKGGKITTIKAAKAAGSMVKGSSKRKSTRKRKTTKRRSSKTSLPSLTGKSKSKSRKKKKSGKRKLPPALKQWNNYVAAVKAKKGVSHKVAMTKAKKKWGKFSDAQKKKARTKTGAKKLPMPR